MKDKWGNKIYRKKEKEKLFEAIQIETSSTCNLRCIFCPTTFTAQPNSKYMTMETFLSLAPYLSLTQWIYLQGWGEPLLNPDIWQMVSISKEAGAKVGFTTNGTFLDQATIRQLVDQEVNLISISLAGATAKTHEAHRVNSNFTELLINIQNLVARKKGVNKDFPKVCVSYMLTKETIWELTEAVKLVYGLGVNDMYVTNLDYCFNNQANQSKLFSWNNKDINDYQQELKKAQEYAVKKGFSFRPYPLLLKDQEPVCEANPIKNIFINIEGDVSPCTYLARATNTRYFKDQVYVIPQKKFGNIDTGLSTIWESIDYQQFRNYFINRQKAYEKLIAGILEPDPSLFKLKEKEREYMQNLIDNPIPVECQTCYKIYGC